MLCFTVSGLFCSFGVYRKLEREGMHGFFYLCYCGGANDQVVHVRRGRLNPAGRMISVWHPDHAPRLQYLGFLLDALCHPVRTHPNAPRLHACTSSATPSTQQGLIPPPFSPFSRTQQKLSRLHPRKGSREEALVLRDGFP